MAMLIVVLIALQSEPIREAGSLAVDQNVTLAHTVVRVGDGPMPALLVRTPYGRQAILPVARDLAQQQGFAIVLQDCRGTGESTGEWQPFRNEASDGAVTLDWLRKQRWCNGKVATYGASYLGITQWQLAPRAGRQLCAMVLEATAADEYRDVVHFGGVQSLAIGLSWALMTAKLFAPPKFHSLPLIDADDATGKDVPYWNEWTRHHVLDDYWRPLDMRGRYRDVKAAALLIAGWYDLFQPGQVNDYMQLAEREGPLEERFARLIVGPWDHGGSAARNGRPDLGPQAYEPTLGEQSAFLARFLKGEANGYERKAGVRAFFLGENQWRELDRWPPARAKLVSFYLHSGGDAAGPASDGVLTPHAPRTAEPADHYRYDPANPTPSYAKDLWMPLSALRDQAEMGKRPDVLSYLSLPLAEPLSVAGPLHCVVFVASDAPDTDFAAKLIDVDEKGVADWRGEGILRARVRSSVYQEELLPAGEPVAMTIAMGHMACTFAERHRLGLQITSSNFPRFSRNLNTAEPSGVARAPRVANQTLLHDPEHASVLKLYVVE